MRNLFIFLMLTFILITGIWTSQYESYGQDMKPVEQIRLPGDKAEVYFPDRPAPTQPRQNQQYQDTIYAKRIVLQGPDMVMAIDADPNRGIPGIAMRSLRTGQSIYLYFGTNGQAVIGLGEPNSQNLSAALFSQGREARVQLSDRNGVHVLQAAEIVNQRRVQPFQPLQPSYPYRTFVPEEQ